MYARATELTEVLSLVRSGRDVAVEGLRGSGRTELLRRVAADLEATNVQVLTRASLRLSRQRVKGGSAVPAAGGGMAGQALDPEGDVDGLLRSLRSGGASVLVMDDADDLPAPTLALLDRVADGLGAPTVSATRPLPRGLRRALPRAARDAFVIALGPLAFPDVVELLRDECDLHADPALVARIATKAAGNPGLIRAIALSAREAGLIAEQGDVWSMTGRSLWNRGLEPVAAQLLSDLSDSEHGGLWSLALAGACSIDDVLRMIDEQTLLSLAGRGLATVIGGGGEAGLLAVTPPLLVDHFRQVPPSPEQLLAHGRVSRLGDHDALSWGPRSDQDEITPIPLPDRADAALARYFADRVAHERAARWHLWHAEPTVRNATLFLESVVLEGVPATDLRAIIRDTSWTTEDPDRLLLDFIGHVDVLAGSSGPERSDADRRRIEIENARPLLVTAMSAQQAIVATLVGGRRLDGTEPGSETHPTAASLVAARSALAKVLDGDGAGGIDVLPDRDAEDPAVLIAARPLIRGLALFTTGRTEAVLTEALGGLAESKRRLDRSGIFLHSYLATLALVRLGRWGDARRVLGTVFALGTPPASLRHEYVGMARLAAMLATREGDPSFAEALLASAAEHDQRDGVVPGSQSGIAVAIRALFGGDQDAAAASMATAATAAMSRGSRIAAVSAQLYAVCLRPSESSVSVLRDLVLSSRLPTHRQFVGFAETVTTNPLMGSSAARTYEPDADVFLAILVLRSLAERADPDRPDIVDSLGEGLSELVRRSGWKRQEEYFPRDDRRVVELTDREREIGLLAGTRSNAQIAALLGLSTRTVANHVSNALRKRMLSSRAELFDCIRAETSGQR